MKALRFLAPYKLEVQEVSTPKPAAGECLLRVRACGICGSDPHGYTGKTGRRIPPMTMGHEFAAEVVQLGEDVTKFHVGDAVIPQPINFCGECENCRQGLTMLCLNKTFFGVLSTDGAMAEYVSVPEKLLYPLPNGTSYYQGALAEPYAVTYGAYKKAGGLENQIVLIIGAGAIGDCLLQLVLLDKPKMVIMADLSDARLKIAEELGATYTINTGKTDALAEIERLTGGHMVDVSFECCGVEPTANLSVKALKIAGKTYWLGMNQKEMTLNMQDVVCSARSVIGSFNYTHQEFGEMINILGSGKMAADKLISAVVSLEEAPAAFENLLTKPDEYLKVIIDPTK